MAGQQIPEDLSPGNIEAMIERAMRVPGMRLTLSRVPTEYAPAPFLATASWSTGGTGPMGENRFPTVHRKDPVDALAFVIRHAFLHGGVTEQPVDFTPPPTPDRSAMYQAARAAQDHNQSADEVDDLLAMPCEPEIEDLLAL